MLRSWVAAAIAGAWVLHLNSIATAATTTPPPALPAPPDHLVLVIEENKPADAVMAAGAAPFLQALATGGAQLDKFYAVTHPSQPNYLALFSGSTQGVTSDAPPR